MRRFVFLILLVAVALCGLQLGERDEAEAHLGETAACLVTVSPDCGDDGGEPANLAHQCHHHCPISPGQRLAAIDEGAVTGDDRLFFERPVALASLNRAPPTQPPSA